MSLYINDIVTSTLTKIGASGSRNVTSSWNTSSNTAYVKVGSTYLNGYYLSNVKIDISFDNNGYLDGYSLSGSVDGARYSESGLHNISYSNRNIHEASYDQIEAREWAEVLITQEKNTIRSTFDAQYYLDKYPEVKAAYGNNLESALDHYVRHGKAVGMSDLNEAEELIVQEKNTIRSAFDADYYIAKYSVFDGVYGNNNDFESVLDHYVRWGKAVGRSFVNEYELSLRDSFTGFSTENSKSLYGSKSSGNSGSESSNSTIIDGGSGIDTITYSALSDSVAITFEKGRTMYLKENHLVISDYNQDQLVISQTNTETIYGGKYGTTPTTSSSVQSETLTNIERLHFSDKGYGLDIDGNTGVAAKVIISAFGAEKLSSKMSSMLTIVDNGITTNELCNYIFSMGLIEDEIGSSTNGSFVDHVYENVVGTAPSSADHNTYTALLDNGTYTKSSLLALAANTTLTEALVTANSVDLIGVPGSADGQILALQYDLGLG
jgi:hypothetical protein